MNKKITIIGGGMTGLTAAYLAAKNGWEVTVLEAEKEMGGLAGTFVIGGNRLEIFYHHFFTHDAEILWLLEELGLKSDLHFKKTTMGVFRNKKIYDFNSPFDLLKFEPMNFFDKILFGFTSLYLGRLAKWEKLENISAMEWFYKYAGKGATEALWKPMLEVKFGPFANNVPVSWMVGRLAQRMNSRKKGAEKLGYLKGSLQRLIDRLINKLEKHNVRLITEAKVTEFDIKDNHIKGVITEKGNFREGQFLVTIPAPYFASLIKPFDDLYYRNLSKIEYFSALCTIIEMEKSLSHIYWLNIADPGYPFGGIIEHTNFVDPEVYSGSYIAYLSRYYAKTENIASLSNSELEKLMLVELKRIYPDFKMNQVKNVYIFKTDTAAPVCGLNFSKKIPECKTPVKSLYIANMTHVYPDERSCNNSIRIAAEACKVIGIETSSVPYGNSLAAGIGMGC